MQDTRRQSRGGFTLIELLVIISIIALLVGILSVGAKRVKVASKGLQQKSMFHAMEVGLELFSGDFDGYPRSALTSNNNAAPYVTGAQHLAEALLGRDGEGFEPLTGWYPPDDKVYRANAPADLYDTLAANSQSLARRKGPYCQLKYGGAYTIYNLWAGSNGASDIYDSGANPSMVQRSPVITDVFSRTEIIVNGESVRVGTPILYFRADSTKPFRVNAARQTVTNPDSAAYRQWVYNFDDNLPILQLPWLGDMAVAGLDKHYLDPDGGAKNRAQVFYEQITQQADAARNYYKPFNADTFLLISAGWDGIFGTKDDIVNFD